MRVFVCARLSVRARLNWLTVSFEHPLLLALALYRPNAVGLCCVFRKQVDLERFAMTENLNEIYYTKN